MSLDTFNELASIGTIVIQLITVALIVFLFLSEKENQLRKWIQTYSLTFGFLAILGAILGSLIYSNVIGYSPCDFCWWQRICMYPQLIIFAIAAWKKDHAVWLYSRILSIIGALLGLYQYYGEMWNTSALPCSATGVSCSKIYFIEFGYITIPVMAFSVFIFLIVLSFYKKD